MCKNGTIFTGKENILRKVIKIFEACCKEFYHFHCWTNDYHLQSISDTTNTYKVGVKEMNLTFLSYQTFKRILFDI